MTKSTKINNILEAYQEMLLAEDGYTIEGNLEYIEKITMESSSEFKNLVNIVKYTPKDSTEQIEIKLSLAEILINLKYEPVKKFLLRIIEMPIEKPCAPEDANITNNRDNQIWAAALLVKLNDARGREYLLKFIEQATQSEKWSIVSELEEIHNNIMAFALLLDLAEKDEYAKSQINTEVYKSNLKIITEANKKK